MAIMIPADCDEFETNGECKFYEFLEEVAKPDPNYIVWYSLEIEKRKFDFLLFNREIGLVVLEVKDWLLEEIIKADKKTVKRRTARGEEENKNPFEQADGYKYAIMDKIRKDGRLVNERGKIKIPLNTGVIFTNIKKSEFLGFHYDAIFDIDRMFFWDNLHESNISFDLSGSSFSKIVKEMFPPLFKFKLTDKEIDLLRIIIFPEISINLPCRTNLMTLEKKKKHLIYLDKSQESIARQLSDGHRIIKGPPGSGKTIVLVHKAKFIKNNRHRIKSILFICYNLTLVGYIKRLLKNDKIPIGRDGVEVYSFYDFCGTILKEDIEHKKDELYYQTITDMVIDELKRCPQKRYDAVLIDEGQDFSDEMFKVVMMLLNEGTNNLTIAMDDNQNLYKRNQSWKELGIHASGRRTRLLKDVYRSTVELVDFFNEWLRKKNNQSEIRDVSNIQTEMFPGFNEFHGPPPLIEKMDCENSYIEFIINTVIDFNKKDGIPLSEIAIVYFSKDFGSPASSSMVATIIDSLDSKGIFNFWVSEDIRAKKSYDITRDCVTVSSIHSIKGFDFSCVLLVGLDSIQNDYTRWSDGQINNLVYVAITRARDSLIIPYLNKTKVIERLIDCLPMSENIKPI